MTRVAFAFLVCVALGGCSASLTSSDGDAGAPFDARGRSDARVTDGAVDPLDGSEPLDAADPLDPGDATVIVPDDAAVDPGVDAAAPPSPDAATPVPTTVERTYRVLHWNVAGSLIHDGDVDDGLIDVLADMIIARDAHFVGLNELCMTQFRALERVLVARGWPADPDEFSRFVATLPAGGPRCHGEAFGNAIFSRLALGPATRITLPDDGTPEHRAMICAPVAALPHVRFCTTHITIMGGDNVRQLGAVLSQLEDYDDAGHTVILTGDLNAHPDDDRMKRFYSSRLSTPNNSGNTGHYRELDDDDREHCFGYGERTVPRTDGGPCGAGPKIDYIFVRQNRIVGDYTEDSLDIPTRCGGACSDHRALFGRVTVEVRR